jgi:hypothetical protein
MVDSAGTAEAHTVVMARAALLRQITALSAVEACQQLGLSEGCSDRTMQDLVDAGQILGYELDGKTIYPSLQFDGESQRVLPIMERLIGVLDHKTGKFYLLYFLVTPNRNFGDLAPKDCFDEHAERVLETFKDDILTAELT